MIKLNLSKFLIVLLIFFMSAFLSFAESNEEGTDEAKPSVDTADAEETQAKIQQKLASIAQLTEGSYSYNPVGKPDPFRPFIDIDVSAKKIEPKKDDSKNLSSIFPLQRVATENFRLVGIIGNETRRLAIVEDAAKKFYPLFKGTHIGTKSGRVIDIMTDRVIVEEREENKPQRVILKLRKD